MSRLNSPGPVELAIAAIRQGGVVVVLDDDDRENEADLVMAAEFADTERVAFFLQHTSGFLCTAITGERADDLALPLMVQDNTEAHGTAFLISVDAATSGTGISAADRGATVRALADRATRPADLNRPGHVLPLRAVAGGVLVRSGHTEAAVDLATLAGLTPAGLLCELITEDRTGMLRGADAVRFAAEHDLPVIRIADLVQYRLAHTTVAERVSAADIPTPQGSFRAVAYRNVVDGVEHVALVVGDPRPDEEVLVRVHSECLTGDLFDSLRCDCGTQLRSAMRMIVDEGCGIIIYLRGQEGRGIGLGHKLRAYEIQQHEGLDTVDANLRLGLPADSREYGMAAHMLRDLGVQRLRLITNNPDKIRGIRSYGLQAIERIPSASQSTPHNLAYLRTKRDRMGHLLDDAVLVAAPRPANG
jgi:GTP cyclohydrolase II/3,4-dihydroxy-2-butanone 4-phosphate synthase